MFIDYITLMLVNMAAGFAILACFFLWGVNGPNHRPWAPAFAMVGLVAFATGLHMTLTWPIPDLSKVVPAGGNLRFANIAFGEMSVLLGALFLGLALAAARGWGMLVLSVYAVLAGVAAIVVGVAIGKSGLTAKPELTAIGFVISGLAGVCSPVVLALRRVAIARAAMTLVLLAAGGIWAVTGYGAYWMHVNSYGPQEKTRQGPAPTTPAPARAPAAVVAPAASAPAATTEPDSDIKAKLRREVSK